MGEYGADMGNMLMGGWDPATSVQRTVAGERANKLEKVGNILRWRIQVSTHHCQL